MTEYITVADVDALLPAGWEGDGDKTRAVLEANAWLSARGVMASDPVEDDIKQAGAYLAQDAAAGNLYGDRAPSLKREMVDADGVKVEEEYQDGASASSGTLRLVNDLLRPYLTAGGGSTFAVRRA
ncbi:DnaT-like ssDNA-binding protein [Halomonas sp. DN3]|uniref:DnaT-like ssDNA-binding protein n=1 Tax=Halomonas sp. DN3 TaxID=2953657 RepID=UPI0020A11098|nr:DnaT-like ssDNA-binding protein [Halomonas sp. DN3]USZ48130.1 hypothetical protein NKF27_11375 [Halomonas sp. DN3]